MFFMVERIMKSTIATAAMPDCKAPMTKYGPKTVEDQPGRVAMAKSQDTMVCTENITGMIANAKMFMAVLQVLPLAFRAAKADGKNSVKGFTPAIGTVTRHRQVRDERQKKIHGTAK